MLYGAIEGGGTKFVCAVGRSSEDVLEQRGAAHGATPTSTLAACVEFFSTAERQVRADRGVRLRLFRADRFACPRAESRADAGDPEAGLVAGGFVDSRCGALRCAHRDRYRRVSCRLGGVAARRRTGLGLDCVCHRRHGHWRRCRASRADDAAAHACRDGAYFSCDGTPANRIFPACVHSTAIVWKVSRAVPPSRHVGAVSSTLCRLTTKRGRSSAAISAARGHDCTHGVRRARGLRWRRDGQRAVVTSHSRGGGERAQGYLEPLSHAGALDTYICAPQLGTRAGIAGAFLLVERALASAR